MSYRVDYGNSHRTSYVVLDEKSGAKVAEFFPTALTERGIEEARRRAELFAASPAMFSALVGLLSSRDERVARGEIPKAYRDGRDGRYAVARAAVEKARNGR